MNPQNAHPGLSPALTVLIAIATGLAVASNYYAQPLLETIATSFNLSVNQAGFIVTAAQLGYATGLLLLVPLGDMFERRGLIVFMTLLAAGGMLITATSATLPMMILGTALTGLFSVVAQILVPLAATLAHPEKRGKTVGIIMSGLLLGILLAGIGNVPGVVVTIIFALPPIVRLTILGIKQVPEDLIEAAESFGASPRQLLFKVQLPLAMPTIMAGVNQTLMLALSMVVIASMIAVGGLGQMVLRGIGRLDMGLAAVGGVGIVILAIILDRLTQSLGRDRRSKGIGRWYRRGPIGLLTRPFIKQA